MKPLKYTVAALALIAAASFTTSANAQVSATSGSVMLGVYDTTDNVTTSFELNLGLYSSLTNGETFNLGSSLNTMLTTAGDAEFAFAATGGNAGGGGLLTKEIGFSNLVPNINNGNDSLPANNTTENTNVLGQVNGFNTSNLTTTLTGTSSNGTAYSAGTIANSNAASFDTELNNSGGSYGLADGGNYILTPLSTSAEAEFDLFTSGSGVANQVGTFTFSGTDGALTLTYNALAVPEPSAYALGLCALAIFWVLKRRNSVA